MSTVVQGLGGGGCIAVTEIIYADLVPLPQRGVVLGIVAVYATEYHVLIAKLTP